MDDLEELKYPIYIALSELTYATVNLRGTQTVIHFCQNEFRYAKVDHCSKVLPTLEWPSLKNLVRTAHGNNVGYTSVMLHYVSDNCPVIFTHGEAKTANSFQALLNNWTCLPSETLDRLYLWNMLTNDSVTLDSQISNTVEKQTALTSKLKILNACKTYQRSQHVPTVDPEAERACSILKNALSTKGWTLWKGTENNQTFLISQYKIVTGETDYMQYCLDNVYMLKSISPQFLPTFSIVDPSDGQPVSIYYSETFNRLDYWKPMAL